MHQQLANAPRKDVRLARICASLAPCRESSLSPQGALVFFKTLPHPKEFMLFNINNIPYSLFGTENKTKRSIFQIPVTWVIPCTLLSPIKDFNC